MEKRHSNNQDDVAAAVSQLVHHAFSQQLRPGLYLVATPIGNLADVTVRAAAVLARAEAVYCEDTRVTGRLLAACGIKRSLSTYHDHNADAARPAILDVLESGAVVALVSDAGVPLISDPGHKLVTDALAAGHHVEAIPGASAVTTAVAVSGLACDAFQFVGFLPAKSVARSKRLGELADVAASLVFYESPKRLAGSLLAMRDVLGNRDAAVARELTKVHEEVRRGCLSELIDWAEAAPVKGEIVVVVAPRSPSDAAGEVDDTVLLEALGEELTGARLKDAAKAVAERFGVPRQRIYGLGLDLKRAASGDGGDDNA